MMTNPQFSQAHVQAHALCSLRTALWVLGAVNAALCFCLLMLASSWAHAAQQFFIVALWLEPASLLCTAVLCILTRRRNVTGLSFAAVAASICFVLAASSQLLIGRFNFGASLQAAGVGAAVGTVGWFLLRQQRFVAAPVLQEADLRSLGAAMRPHFFFNALNAVMGLIRANPRQAEDMLQDTAELFRDVMAQDQHRLVRLDAELDTTLRYLRIEQARLAARLRVEWEVDDAFMGVVLPPFALQLLVENAVRHGIEPLPLGGQVHIQIVLREQQVQIQVRNPLPPAPQILKREGATLQSKPNHNGVALANLRQRLVLLYDEGAQLTLLHEAHTHSATLLLPLEFES